MCDNAISFPPGDGMSFDNIAIEEVTPPKMLSITRGDDLMEVHPNPFSQSTTISFNLHETRSTILKVFDLRGNEVARLFEGIAEAGTDYQFTFHGEAHGNGIYTVYLQSGKEVHLIKKVLLNK